MFNTITIGIGTLQMSKKLKITFKFKVSTMI